LRSIHTLGEIRIGAGGTPAEVLLDTGAQINLISETLAKQLGLERTPADLPSPQWLTGETSYCYGAYQCMYRLTDDWRRTRDHTSLFYSMDLKGPPIVLGMPALRQCKIVIDLSVPQWRFNVGTTELTLEEPEQFVQSLEEGLAAFAVVGVMAALEESPRVAGVATTLPKEFRDYEDVFSKEAAGQLPPFKEGDHAIDLEGKEPPYGPLYNLSSRELEVLRDYLDDAMAKGLIQRSISPAGAPVLFVPKKDGTLRLCVDYRGLNKVTIKNRHPLPLISETLDRLGGAKYFTKFDLKDAYHRIRIRRGDEWKTAFRTRYGHFEYLVMPFGLANAPATFQAYINRALAGLVDINCVVYLDDILIYSGTAEEHEQHIRQVLERLRKFQLYVNLSKCAFKTNKVEFLGFIISREGVSMDERRVAAIKEWPAPKTYREIQVFLGFANFYRRFIQGYSKITVPLSGLLKGSKEGKKSGPFQWPDDADQAFRRLRDAFVKAPMLIHFNPTEPIRIETDASDFAMGAILSQPDPGKTWHPCAYWSKKFIDAEIRYKTHDKELLAIVLAFKHWRHYVEGSAHTVEVLTDHNNLKGFMEMKQLNGTQARWAMGLAAYDFVIKYRPGKSNPADAPSRRPDYEGGAPLTDDLLPELQQKLIAIGVVRDLSLILRPEQIAGRSPRSIIVITSPLTPQGHAGEARGATGNDVPEYEGGRILELSEEELKELSAGLETPVSARSETPAEHQDDIAETPDAIAGITAREQRVPRRLARQVASSETAYSRQGEEILSLLEKLQLDDEFVRVQGNEGVLPSPIRREDGALWAFDSQGLLRYNDAVYVPAQSSVREELIKLHHDDPLAGHFGVEKTQDLIKRKYYWRELDEDVKEYLEVCEICQRTKARRHRPYGEMQALPRPDQPWREITMDFITGLPPSKKGSKVSDAILVVVDRYSKMARYIPTVVTLDASELLDILTEEVFLRYGFPSGIVTDRGSLFTSSFWSEVCYVARIKRRLSTAFHPQTDGQTERQNQTLEQYLRMFCNDEQDNWATILSMAEFAYNNAHQSSIKMSPFYAVYGYQPFMRFQLMDYSRTETVPNARERIERLHQAREELETRWETAKAQQAKYYNKRHSPMTFNIGDLVLLSTKNLRQRRPSKKLSHRFIGPFRVLEPIGTQAYRLALPMKWKVHPVFHVSYLEPYYQGIQSELNEEMPPPELVNDQEEYEVEEILDQKLRKGEKRYLVKWKGWSDDYNQWVLEQDMENAPELRRRYERSHPARRRGRAKR
jgi:hypothetical protein